MKIAHVTLLGVGGCIQSPAEALPNLLQFVRYGIGIGVPGVRDDLSVSGRSRYFIHSLSTIGRLE